MFCQIYIEVFQFFSDYKWNLSFNFIVHILIASELTLKKKKIYLVSHDLAEFTQQLQEFVCLFFHTQSCLLQIGTVSFLGFLSIHFLKNIYLFSFSCGTWDLYLWHVGSSSVTRDQTPGHLQWESRVLAAGPPGKSHLYTFYLLFCFIVLAKSFSTGWHQIE